MDYSALDKLPSFTISEIVDAWLADSHTEADSKLEGGGKALRFELESAIKSGSLKAFRVPEGSLDCDYLVGRDDLLIWCHQCGYEPPFLFVRARPNFFGNSGHPSDHWQMFTCKEAARAFVGSGMKGVESDWEKVFLDAVAAGDLKCVAAPGSFFRLDLREYCERKGWKPSFLFGDVIAPNSLASVAAETVSESDASAGAAERYAEQIRAVVLFDATKNDYNPLKIPNGRKKELREFFKSAGPNSTFLLSESCFDRGWRRAVEKGFFQMEDHDKYAPKK